MGKSNIKIEKKSDVEISTVDKLKEKMAIALCLITCIGLFLKIVFF
ncbi:MAG TPA: hypothetical protein PLG90_07820 [Ignavibacteria bacterium]|nr:hypothetical protein [Ignavibacteria bacterium]